MSLLDHPNVVRIHHFGKHQEGNPFFLMPVYPASLASRMAEHLDDPFKSMH